MGGRHRAEYQEQEVTGQIYSGVFVAMLRDYRGIVVALAGLILAADQPPAKRVGAPSEKQTSAQVTREPPPLDLAVEKPNSTPSADKGCGNGRDNRQSDLCAQWKAADAAFDAARAGEVQLIIGWIGLAFGLLTMTAAIAAALYAKRAAIATESTVNIAQEAANDAEAAIAIATRNADAAQQQVEVARNGSIAQLRAYLAIENVSGTLSTHGPMPDGSYQVVIDIEFELKNYGQSIADNIGLEITLSPINNGPDPFDKQLTTAARANPFHLAPGARFPVKRSGSADFGPTQLNNPAYVAVGVVYWTAMVDGARQVGEEYLGTVAMPNGKSAPLDISVIRLSGKPVALHLENGYMAGRMT